MTKSDDPNQTPNFSISENEDILKLFKNRLPETFYSNAIINKTISEKDKDDVPIKILKDTVDTSSFAETKKDILSDTAVKINMDEVIIKPISLRLSEREKTVLILKKNILSTIRNISSFIHEPYAEEILLYAATKEPEEIFKRFDDYKSKFFATKVLETAGKYAPITLKKYLYNPSHPIYNLLIKSNDTIIKELFKMPTLVGYQSKAYILADAIIKKRLTPAEAESICNSP
ncbi:MAG: hypothetical protein RMJ53_03400, partial [Chitinophagales bacterium]|nr:hypothetical protein [Chitinophagales bacterium]